MNQQRPVETVEDFKLRIAAIIRAKPEQIPHAAAPTFIKASEQQESKTSKNFSLIANRSELCVFASRAPASGFQRNSLREML
jgi:hypothetical protein